MHVVVELCAKSQLLKGGQMCDAAKKKKKEYQEKYKEAVVENKKA